LSAEINATCAKIRPIDLEVLAAAEAKQMTLTKPPGSLGRLEEIGNRVAAITESLAPDLSSKRIFVVAGDHGVTSEGVSAYPREVTHQMVLNFLSGGAAINVLSRHNNIDVQVVDAGVDYEFQRHPHNLGLLVDRKIVRGTKNLAAGPALTQAQAEQAIIAGIDLAVSASGQGINLLGIGEMGIGNTTAASAITAVITGRSTQEVTGRGTGINDSVFAHKVEVIDRGLAVNTPDPGDPIDVLSKVGGAEIGVMMGVVLGAAAERIPVVADGFISTAAAALAVSLCPNSRDYLFVAHRSKEAGHRALIEYLGLGPLLDLEMGLGEGTGAALAMNLIDASAKILSEMATFSRAGVTDKDQIREP
jgi:nicotinate-nucleotide--dimethylbenzimidazole phosphoribosyltransferase